MSTPEFVPGHRIADLHSAYRLGQLNPTEVIETYLTRSRQSNHNAVLLHLEDRARAQAKQQSEELEKALTASKGKTSENAVDTLLERFPLFGVPLGVKDLLTMKGVRTTCGSRILENYIPPYTATAVERLESAGAISISKLNMDEFAMGGSNENSAFGPVLHPHDPKRVPGGSSGGSATAVGADLCVAALGTDTGGSIRLPASYCGIVGFKPTYGRVSRYGLVAFASSLDQIGPMTKNVDDAARVLGAMAGFDPKDSTCAPHEAEDFLAEANRPVDWSKVRIGIPREYEIDKLKPEVAKATRLGIDWFRNQGAIIKEVSLPHSRYSVAVYYIVAVSEASSNLSRFDGVRFGSRPVGASDVKDPAEFYELVRSQFGAEVKRRIILGTFALSSGYYDAYYRKACQVRRLISQDFQNVFQEVDCIMGPVSTSTAFKLGEKANDPIQMYLNDLFTIPANLAGLPAISVPSKVDAGELPIGLHLIGPSMSDGRLLQLARAYEGRNS